MYKSHKHFVITLIILASMLTGLMSCGEAPFDPSRPPYRFPIAIGNSWDYSVSNIRFIFDDTTNSNLITVDTTTGSSTTEVLALDENSYSAPAYQFHTTWEHGPDDGQRDDYFNNQTDGFYLYGYTSSGWVGPPKLAPGDLYYEFKGLRASSLVELTEMILAKTFKRPSRSLSIAGIEDPPIREWAYPLNVGKQWMYRDLTLDHAWDMDKKVIERTNIEVPAGNFDCYTIRWFWDTDKDGQWDTDIDGYDYVSSVGVVRRQFIFYNVEIIDYTHTIIGYSNTVHDYSLSDYELH